MTDQTKALTRTDRPSIEGVESALVEGDLAKLTPDQRVTYYEKVCDSVGLNPLTKPFAYIRLNGKLTLYAKRDAAEQLRKIHGISITKMETEQRSGGDIYIVRAYAEDSEGRTDVASGAVDLSGKRGESLANAYMKAETKAKRRVTLSMGGLGWLDETEVSDIPDEAVQAVSYAEAENPRGDGQQGAPAEAEETSDWQPSPKLQKRLQEIDAKLSSADDVEAVADTVMEHIKGWPSRPRTAAAAIVDEHLGLA